MADQDYYAAPTGDPRADAMAEARARYGITEAPFHARTFFGQGTAMGGGDELEAWLRSKLSGKPQEPIRQEIMKDVRGFAKKYPVSAAQQEFVGATLPSIAMSFIPPLESVTMPQTVGALDRLRQVLSFNPERPVLSGAKVGGVYGTAGGALSAEPGQRVSGATIGATGGIAFGGALPIVAKTGANIIDMIWRHATGPSEKAAAKIATEKLIDEMRVAGIKTDDLLNFSADDYARLGIPSTIAHYLPSATEAVIAKAGTPESGKLATKIRGVQRGETKRVEERFRTALKPKDYFATSDELTSNLRANAKTMYDEAYAFGEVNDPRIQEVLTHPKFKAAFEDAKGIVSTEAAAAKLRGEDASQYTMRELYIPREVKPGIFELELKSIPDVRTLDYIKRGLDSVIEKGYKGEGMSSAEASALKALRNEYVKAIDENVPAYAAARRKYAGEMEVKDALEMGMTGFNKLKHEEVTKFMATASDAEKEAFRTGAVRYLQDTIFDKPNAAGQILRSDKLGNKLQALFDSPEEYALIKAALEKEALFYSHASDALAGSRTTPKAEAVKRVESGAKAGAGNIVGPVVQFLIHGEEKISPQVLGKMADMLSAGSPAEVAAVVRTIEKREKVVNKKRILEEAATKGTIAGTTGGTAIPIGDTTTEISAGTVLLNELMDYWDAWKMGGSSDHQGEK